MRLADAPQAGWYPDPERRARLRWWDGSDWADHWRAPPAVGATDRAADAALRGGQYEQHGMAGNRNVPLPPGFPNVPNAANSAQIVEQVRLAARSEAQRAAHMFGAQARSVTQNLTPLISEYTNKFARLVKQLMVIAILLVVAWFVFQAWANMSLFDWIGDRIDNLSETVGDEDAVGSSSVGVLWQQ